MRLAVHITLFVFVSAVCASLVHIQARNSSTQADSAILKRWPSPVDQPPSAVPKPKHIQTHGSYGDWGLTPLKTVWDNYGKRLPFDSLDIEIYKLPSVYIMKIEDPGEDQAQALKTMRDLYGKDLLSTQYIESSGTTYGSFLKEENGGYL